MPVLALLYMSSTLAEIGDPLTLLREMPERRSLDSAAEPQPKWLCRAPSAVSHQPSAGGGRKIQAEDANVAAQFCNADDLVAMVRTQLQRHFEGTIEDAASEGPDDDAWYWAAPILLDLERAPHTRNWWTRKDLSREWKALVDEDEEDDDGGWEEHVAQAKRVLGGWKPTGRPPADLLDVLAKLAVAGPAVCALRSLSRIVSVDDDESRVFLLDGAGRIAWALRSMFNRWR